MENKSKRDSKKTATNNKWVSTGLNKPSDKTERKDGPGGEGAN